ncbi:MAG: hypothetical protein U0694_26765 [Anaerolineae bacterium]
MMKLTGRQRAFLSAFIDLYNETMEPLHYSQIAEKLGVSAITAYDMLRILEKRGLVQSSYTQHAAKRGRTSIVFSPTPMAQQIFTALTSEAADWEQVRELIFSKLATNEADEYQGLVEELLDRLPAVNTPLLFMTEMVAAVIISLQLSHSDIVAKLRAAGFPQETGLSALEGLAVALALAERFNRRFLKLILVQNRRSAAMLASLSRENNERLTVFVDELLGTIDTTHQKESE